jgi:hypothetical protein
MLVSVEHLCPRTTNANEDDQLGQTPPNRTT